MNNPANIMQVAVATQNSLGECTLWCERQQALLWTDIIGQTLYRFMPATGISTQWQMPEQLGSFALTLDDDRLLLGLASQLAYFCLSTGELQSICPVESELTNTRINDGRCDRQGRFVFGTFNQHDQAAIGGFYRLNHDLSLERLPLRKVAVANSICFSPDGATMYYADSEARQIFCCDYHPVTGEIRNDRLFVDLRHQAGAPDGSCIDAAGYLWNAEWRGARIVRYNPLGMLDRSFTLPASQITCLCFGGQNLREIFISSARVSLDEITLQSEPHAGAIIHVALDDVQGLPEERFLGKYL